LPIEGLRIDEGRSTGCRLLIGLPIVIAEIVIRRSVDRHSSIVTPSIDDRHPPIGNGIPP